MNQREVVKMKHIPNVDVFENSIKEYSYYKIVDIKNLA